MRLAFGPILAVLDVEMEVRNRDTPHAPHTNQTVSIAAPL